MGIVVLSIVLQALLIVHCIKSGRNTIWIWVLALLSYAGVIAYLVVEVLPEVFGSRTARRTARARPCCGRTRGTPPPCTGRSTPGWRPRCCRRAPGPTCSTG